MFNKTIIQGGDSKHHHEHIVKEYRAPTDESVKLLAEFEEKMRDRVKSVISISNNKFNCRCLITNDQMNFKDTAYCDYILNGRVRSFEVDFREDTLKRDKDHIRLIAQHIAKQLSEDIVLDLLQSMVGGTTFIPSTKKLFETLSHEECDELVKALDESREKRKKYEAEPQRKFFT